MDSEARRILEDARNKTLNEGNTIVREINETYATIEELIARIAEFNEFFNEELREVVDEYISLPRPSREDTKEYEAFVAANEDMMDEVLEALFAEYKKVREWGLIMKELFEKNSERLKLLERLREER